MPLEFIPNLPQEFLAPFDVGIGLESLGLDAVDDAQDAAALLAFRDDDFDGIRGGAETRLPENAADRKS